MPQITRAALVRGVERALERSQYYGGAAYDPPTAAEAQALWDVAHTTDRVALGAYCLRDCGCPMVQAGLADARGNRRHMFALGGGLIDRCVETGNRHGLFTDVYEVVD